MVFLHNKISEKNTVIDGPYEVTYNVVQRSLLVLIGLWNRWFHECYRSRKGGSILVQGTHIERVVLFTASLVGGGGAERLLWEEEKFFKEKGVNVTVVSFFFSTDSLFDYLPGNLRVVECGSSRISMVIALRKVLKELGPDLVIGASNVDGMYLYLATALTHIPYMVHIHGTLFWFTGDVLKYSVIHKRVFSEIRGSCVGHAEFVPENLAVSLRRRLSLECFAMIDWLSVRRAEQVIVLTNQIKWEVRKLYGRDSIVARGCLSKETLNYIPKIDIKKKLGLADKRIVLSIGRLDPRKRIDLLIRSFAKVASDDSNICLVIGGTGVDRERLELLAQELNTASCIKFVGFIPDSELYDYYAGCEVFAFPSWTSSGITPYEALAVGKKVVWTSEADEPILTDEFVFVAEPSIKGFVTGLRDALTATNVESSGDLAAYTWEKYFETVYEAALQIGYAKRRQLP